MNTITYMWGLNGILIQNHKLVSKHEYSPCIPHMYKHSAHTHTHTHAHTYTRTRTRTHIHTHTHTNPSHSNSHTHTHTQTHAHTHTNTHTQTHTYVLSTYIHTNPVNWLICTYVCTCLLTSKLTWVYSYYLKSSKFTQARMDPGRLNWDSEWTPIRIHTARSNNWYKYACSHTYIHNQEKLTQMTFHTEPTYVCTRGHGLRLTWYTYIRTYILEGHQYRV